LVSLYIHKSHNVSVLLYHLVCTAKYRRVIFNHDIDKKLIQVCLELAKRYEIHFLEIGADNDHVHFLIQSTPTYSPTKIVRTIKSITARQVFRLAPEVRLKLWGGEFWSDGYYINTVSRHGNENVVTEYVKKQGRKDYVQLHKSQLKLL